MIQQYAHRTVAHVAAEMAQEVFEYWAKDNEWYARNKHLRSKIVTEVAKTLRPAAREALGEMLGRHDITEHVKAEIYEAIQLDRQLPDNFGMKNVG